jgi:signal transduction histidine kinase
MDATLRALRDFITSDVRTREVRRRVAVVDLVREAIAQIREFARVSQIEIRWVGRDRDLVVYGSERDLMRAVANLLHNAVKYSWRRDESGPPWVGVQVRETARRIEIEVENWGVPISAEEIDQGLVYELGYRGKWSTDRGRLGTGIGLTDAQRTVLAHGGEIAVESHPARADPADPAAPRYYRQPFLTRVTVRLPSADG